MAKLPARDRGDGYELTTHLVTKVGVTRMGKYRFTHMPRIGEWIEIAEKNERVTYQVLMVAHATTGGTDDLYVQRLGDREAAANSLRKLV